MSNPASHGEDVGFHQRIVSDFRSDNTLPGKGLDIGTTHVVGVARRPDGTRVYNAQRNAFIDVRDDDSTRRILSRLGIRHHFLGDHGCVLGDPAFVLANAFGKEVRQPVRAGILNPSDPSALPMLRRVVAEVIGEAKVPGEPCTVSMPADPLDSDGNAIYHRGAILAMLKEMGYAPTAVGQADAVCFSELADANYTGIVVSCGGGMFNVSVAYKSIPAIRFAIARGGDWIDANVARALGIPAPQACDHKERLLDLAAPGDRTAQAIAIYCQSLVRYTLEAIREKFSRADDIPSFTRPVPLICCGGMAQADGFLDLFRRELAEVDFPIPVSEVRLAANPTLSVADGCLSASEVLGDSSHGHGQGAGPWP